MPASHVLIWLESKQPWFRLYSMRTFAKWLNQSLTWQEEAPNDIGYLFISQRPPAPAAIIVVEGRKSLTYRLKKPDRTV